jgi:hypothetical protein
MLCIPISMVPTGPLQDNVPGWRIGPGAGNCKADDAMPPEGLPVASERAGGESRPCLDSSERMHWAKYCSARRLIPLTRVTKSQSQGQMHGYESEHLEQQKSSQVIFR